MGKSLPAKPLDDAPIVSTEREPFELDVASSSTVVAACEAWS